MVSSGWNFIRFYDFRIHLGVLETVSRQPSTPRIWINVSTALLQTNVADYATLNVHMNGVP